MTPKQRAVIERARLIPARFIEIERTSRFTACRNMQKQMSPMELARMIRSREAAHIRKVREENDTTQ